MNIPLHLAGFEIHGYSLPYRRPVRWFDSVEVEGRYLLLRLQADDGSVGVAEAPVRPSWSGVSRRSLLAALEDLFLPALLTVDLGDEAAVRAALDRFPENGLAKMLVDNACATLRARAAGQPLWRRWGGGRRVALGWCVTRQPPDDMAAEAAAMVERHGFASLKIKGGQGLATDVDAVRRIRRAVGEGVSLSVDANCAYRLDDSLAWVSAMAGEGVALVEDPCPLLPDDGFSTLVREAALPVLVDTPCASWRDALHFLEKGAQVLSIKPGRVGQGEAWRVATLVRERGARPVAGLYGESSLGTLVGLSFGAALEQPATPAEMSFFLMLERQVLATPLMVADGHVSLPDTTDLDAMVDWDAVRHFRWESA